MHVWCYLFLCYLFLCSGVQWCGVGYRQFSTPMRCCHMHRRCGHWSAVDKNVLGAVHLAPHVRLVMQGIMGTKDYSLKQTATAFEVAPCDPAGVCACHRVFVYMAAGAWRVC